MRQIRIKTKRILRDNSGETIVEAVVAFALLSIMLVLFAQGLAWATNTELKASDNRKSADDSMYHLQKHLATTPKEQGNEKIKNGDVSIPIRRYVYEIDGNDYIVYEAD